MALRSKLGRISNSIQVRNLNINYVRAYNAKNVIKFTQKGHKQLLSVDTRYILK